MRKSNFVILFFPDTQEALDRIMVPLSVYALAAVLEKEDIPFVIIDARIDKDYKKKILDLVDGGAGAIGMSVQTGPQIGSALDMCGRIKEQRPEFPVIWGGWHASILPEQTVAHPHVDFVIRGQGERSLTELWRCMQNGENFSRVAGIGYKKDGKPFLTRERAFVNLDEFPPLPFHLVDLKRYPGRATGPDKVFANYRSSQGCPWRCAYCADPLVFKRRWLSLSAERLVDELESLGRAYGVNEVFFVDDTFVISPERIRKICRELIRRRLAIEWQACARTGMIAKMDQADIDLMAQAGCVHIHPGVEAPTQALLDYIEKDEKEENTFLCAEKLARANIRGLYSFMVRYPREPSDTISKTFKVIKRLKEINPDNICPVNFFIPYPGNQLFEEAIAKGLKRPESLEDWCMFNTRTGRATPWVSPRDRAYVIKMDKYYLPAAFPSRALQKKMQAGRLRRMYGFFHKMARYRVERERLSFCWDWWLLLGYWKFWEKLHRKISLHNIFFR